jgi:hypothetical protein
MVNDVHDATMRFTISTHPFAHSFGRDMIMVMFARRHKDDVRNPEDASLSGKR